MKYLITRAVLIVLAQCSGQPATNDPMGSIRLQWDNPSFETLVDEQVTGYLLKHAQLECSKGATLTNFLMLPVLATNPPTTVLITGLPTGWHAFTLQSSNVLGVSDPSNVAVGTNYSWLLHGQVNVFVQSPSVSNITITLQPQ